AGRLQIRTVKLPSMMMPGPPGTHGGSMHGKVCDVIVAAGMLLIMTVGAQFVMIISIMHGCGAGVGTGAGGWLGAWQCGASCFALSFMRAALALDCSSLRRSTLVQVDDLPSDANVLGGIEVDLAVGVDLQLALGRDDGLALGLDVEVLGLDREGLGRVD